MEVLTLGHSYRPLAEIAELLTALRVGFVADVRRFPGEKKHPGYGKEAMEKLCLDIGVTHVGLGRQLGGARTEGYRAYIETEPFREGLEELIDLARRRRTLVFCREAFFFRCHRKYLGDELMRQGWNVTHVLDQDRSFKHRVGGYRAGSRPDECE
jgi:uncharacterized protein (DUF488 family)